MSDRRPLTKVQWVVVVAAVCAIVISLGKCSTSNTSSSHSVFDVPAPKSTTPRREISPDQREKMKALLTPYAGSKITTISTASDEESQAFGAQLDAIFREAGWQADVQTNMTVGSPPSIFLRVPKSHIPESKVKEFANSPTDVTLTMNDLPPQDLALLKAFNVLNMDCPLETMDGSKDNVELRIGRRP
jgi:hypothetical protein